MIKIKDRIFLGIISGIIASIPSQLLNVVEHKTKNYRCPIFYGCFKNIL